MRILVYGINYSPEVTSTGKYTGEMGGWLASRGHEVRVVTAPPYYPMWKVEEGYSERGYRREWIADAEVWRCPLWVPEKPTGLKRILHLASFSVSSFPAMVRQAFWRPDVVILIEPPLFCAPAAWLTGWLSQANTWLHVQDFELDAAMGLGIISSNKMRHLLYRIEKLLLRGAARTSTITETMRRRLVAKGVPEDHTILFPNWADLRVVSPKQHDVEVRQEFGADRDDVLVLYAGNIGDKQGLEVILDAAYQLRGRNEIKFAIVGAGAARERLEEIAAERKVDNVRFFPVQASERFPLMMAAGDIHLVVQRREAADLVMPSKLTNILAAGRPAVATADPGTELYRVLAERGCGMATTPESAEELADAIEELAGDAEERRRLGHNARRYAEEHLDKEKILSRFEQELETLVEGWDRESSDPGWLL